MYFPVRIRLIALVVLTFKGRKDYVCRVRLHLEKENSIEVALLL